MAASLLCADTVSRVSSVLQRDVKQYGKQFLFDQKEETCWNSDKGSTQWITLQFPHRVFVSQMHIQFQGGFSSETCLLEGSLNNAEFLKIADLYPEDINALQKFSFSEHPVTKLKISFSKSTDFFGRIIIYHLDVCGRKE
ncbi:nuclear receptor 2C2-associated protein [Pelodytes ibericus]